jgi:hypothetical protein
VPLPPGVRCCAVAATLQDGSVNAMGESVSGLVGGLVGDLAGGLLGDGLVPVASALGRNTDPRLALGFLPNNQCLLHNTGHLQLLQSPAVAAQLRQWLA